jgi:hypothetical protein
MNITIDQLMATIGRLHVTIDLQAAEIQMLKNTIEATTPKPTKTETSDSVSASKE